MADANDSSPGRHPQDEAVIEQARQGSTSAMNDLLAGDRPYLEDLAKRRLSARLQAKVAASDLVQETYLEAARQFGQFTGSTRAQWRAWLKRILLNNLVDAGRRYQDGGKRDVGLEISLDAKKSASAPSFPVVATGDTPSQQAVCREERLLLARALARLPDAYREVIVWRNQQHLTFPAIGRLMNRSADAARKLWATAVERLQEALEESGTS